MTTETDKWEKERDKACLEALNMDWQGVTKALNDGRLEPTDKTLLGALAKARTALDKNAPPPPKLSTKKLSSLWKEAFGTPTKTEPLGFIKALNQAHQDYYQTIDQRIKILGERYPSVLQKSYRVWQKLNETGLTKDPEFADDAGLDSYALRKFETDISCEINGKDGGNLGKKKTCPCREALLNGFRSEREAGRTLKMILQNAINSRSPPNGIERIEKENGKYLVFIESGGKPKAYSKATLADIYKEAIK